MNISTILKDIPPDTRKRIRDMIRQRLIRNNIAYDSDAELSEKALSIVNETIAANSAETLEVVKVQPPQSDLRNELKMQKRIKDLELLLSEAQDNSDSFKKDNDSYKSEILKLGKNISDLETAQQESERQVFLLKQDIATAKQVIGDLKSTIHNLEVGKAEAEKRTKQHSNIIAEREARIRVLMSEIEKHNIRFSTKAKAKLHALYLNFDAFNFVNIITNAFAFLGFYHIFNVVGVVMLLICGAAYFGGIKEVKSIFSNMTLSMSFIMLFLFEVVYYFVHKTYFFWLLKQFATIETEYQDYVSIAFAALMSGIGFYAVLMTYLKRKDKE